MRTITIKGIGKISKSPDAIVITMSLRSFNKDYSLAIDKSTANIEEINDLFQKLGFEKNSIKTTNFNVNTKYENVKDGDSYKYVFAGYECFHDLKIQFDFNTKKLSEVLEAISKTVSQPKINIRFCVKDPTDLKNELLKSATINAKEKAITLCEASGVKLGDLMTIDYSWTDINLYSQTTYLLEDKCLKTARMANNIEITPEDVDFSNTVTFVWEIK